MGKFKAKFEQVIRFRQNQNLASPKHSICYGYRLSAMSIILKHSICKH